MIEKALTDRWVVTPEQRARVIARALDLIEDDDPRTQLGAIRALFAADQLTLAWREFELKVKQAEGDGSIDLVAIARGMVAKLSRGELDVVPASPPPVPE